MTWYKWSNCLKSAFSLKQLESQWTGQIVSTVPLSLSSDRQHSAPVPGSFILLQKHTHPLLLKLKSLASVLSGTVQQSSCTLCLLTSVRFNPPMHPSELFNWPLPIPVTFILCTLVCTLASVVWEEYSILSTFVFLYISWTYFCWSSNAQSTCPCLWDTAL